MTVDVLPYRTIQSHKSTYLQAKLSHGGYYNKGEDSCGETNNFYLILFYKYITQLLDNHSLLSLERRMEKS